MASQITFYEKNKIDLDNPNVLMTVADSVATSTGESFISYVRNRKNSSAWITTGSSDAGTTTIDINMGSSFAIDTIMLIGNNWKSYTITYFDGATYSAFPTAISETTNTAENNRHQFASTSCQLIKIIINETQVADADKILKQLIITEELGQLDGWPMIKKPTHSTNKRRSKMLSGKTNLVESVGAFSCELSVENWKSDSDLIIIENIYSSFDGVLVQLNGFDEDQFSSKRIGYRNQDCYLMKPSDSYTPEWASGLYTTGLKIKIKLEEVIR